ncbi:MAG: hypothetical protein WBC85_12940 [Planktotalea sp.]|uniref:hypothetical protein n=1 Tax=Planktotalea sp. TaxID=2029877 RepID=UPI003C777EDD
MEKLNRRNVFLSVAATGFFSSCSEQAAFEWKPETDADRALRENREKLQRTVGEGGLVGAGGGALLGAALGGVGGAVRGAQIGRLGGAGAGLYVKQLQKQYADKEALSNKIITDLRVTNANLEASLRAINAVVTERRQRAAQSQVDATRDARNIQEAAALVSAAKGQEEFFTSTRGLVIQEGINTKPSGIDGELARLRSRVKTLRAVSQELANI